MSSTPSPSPTAWLEGTIFSGHFEVGHLIARGGMAEVYHGVDLWSNNPVAIKVLFPQFSADPSQQQKFFREERSLRQINHSHVVGVLGSGTEEIRGYKLMFIVLDYVHGATLQQLLALRPVLSVKETLEIMLPAIEGLSEVHAHRLIHRDIKPSNVLLSATEHSVKLTDFGLTRRTDQTWTGELMGTPAYVAPEIVDQQATVGPGVDIFASGIMMFRMLTGRLPFPGLGDDQQVIYHNVNTEIPTVTQYAPGVSPDLAGIIRWCTRKQTAARPENGTELFEVLTDLAHSLTRQELDYRADVWPVPHSTIWEAVEEIAEKTGASRALGRTSITGFGNTGYDDVYDPGAEEYEPTAISGVGPEPKPATTPLAATDTNHTMTDNTDIFTDDSPASYPPISAEYRREKSRQEYPRTEQAENQATAPPDSGNPRYPQIQWRERPTAVSLLLLALLLLFGFVAAGFIGWQLANSLITSGWFNTWTNWFG